jgi:hypothetical protein
MSAFDTFVLVGIFFLSGFFFGRASVLEWGWTKSEIISGTKRGNAKPHAD